MPTTEGDHDPPEPDGAASQRTPIDHPSRRLRTDEIDDLVEAALSDRLPAERAPREAPVPDPYLGVEVDRRYVIEGLIAAGGMGLVYRCRHRVLGKKLAIKIIRSDVAHMPDGSERFMLEAKAASSIGNEHIVDIVDFGSMSDGSPYLVMEYLEGISLAALSSEQPRLGIARIARIASQIAEGLGAAHAAGIVHRDLKPDNVFVLDRKGDDFIKVLDFGVARMVQNAKKLTRAGTIVGTPHYMSPEQAMGLEVDHRGDIYALGVILYELLAGRVPFDGEHYVAVLHQHLQAEPPAFASFDPPVDIPPALERIVGRCLAKAPEDRFATMEQLARELAAFRDTGLVLLGPAPDDPPPPVAPSYPPALPAPGLARAARIPGTARPTDPLLEVRALPAIDRGASGAPPAPRQSTLVLPRPSGPFTLPQKRFVTSLSVIVLIGVCVVAAFRFGTSQGRKLGEPARAPLPGVNPSLRSADPAAPSPPAPASRSESAASPALPVSPAVAPELPASAPVAPPPALDAPPAGVLAAGGRVNVASEAPPNASPEATNADSSAAGGAPSSDAARRPEAGRDRRETGPARRGGSARPAKPRSREEFMNPWPAPRR